MSSFPILEILRHLSFGGIFQVVTFKFLLSLKGNRQVACANLPIFCYLLKTNHEQLANRSQFWFQAEASVQS